MARLSKRLAHQYEELRRFLQSAPPLERLQQTVAEVLRTALDLDALALMQTDPVTFLGTGVYTHGFPERARAQFFGQIYLQNETRSFLDLRASGEMVSRLSDYTHGRLETEPRYRELYRPAGLRHEVRVCLRTGDAYWGGLCILRGDDHRDFTATEQQFLALLAPHLGEALRTAAIRRGLEAEASDGLVTLLVDREQRILFQSTHGPELLAGFESGGLQSGGPHSGGPHSGGPHSGGPHSGGPHSGGPHSGGPQSGGPHPALPPQLAAVLALLHANRQRPGGPRLEPRLTVRDGQDHWWTVSALEPGAGNQPLIDAVLVIAPARPEERFPRLMAACNLTQREREMVELVAAGLSTREIAGRLYVTDYTVQDHLKKIFAKVGVTSRRELMALLFQNSSPLGPAPGRW